MRGEDSDAVITGGMVMRWMQMVLKRWIQTGPELWPESGAVTPFAVLLRRADA